MPVCWSGILPFLNIEFCRFLKRLNGVQIDKSQLTPVVAQTIPPALLTLLVAMKRGSPFELQLVSREGGRRMEDPMRPTAAKVFRGRNCHPTAAGGAAEALSASSCERRKTSSDSDSSGCFNGSGSEGVALVEIPVLEEVGEGKCRVCLWPRGSTHCYH